MSRSRLSGLTLATALAAAASADAEPLAIVTGGELPFSRTELESALVLRAQLAAPASGSTLEARVTAHGSFVHVALADRARDVALEDARGADAARLVAFAILDLAGDRLEPPAARPIELGDRVDDRATTSRPAGLSWAIGAWVATGTRDEASLEVVLGLPGPVHAIVAAGTSREEVAAAIDARVARRAFPARAGAGVRIGPFDLRATGLAVVERATAERAATNILFGGGLSASYSVPGSLAGFRLRIGAGADAFASRIDYRVHDMPVISTPRFGWWAGLGLVHEVLR